MIIAGEGLAGCLVFGNGSDGDDGQGLHPQVGSIEAATAAIGTRAVEACVLHQRFAYIQRKDTGKEKAGIPTDSPRIVFARYLAAKHPGKRIIAAEIEGTGEAAGFQLGEQGFPVGIEMPPRPCPCCPSPASRPLDEEGVGSFPST